jgi:nitrous oxide reductase accessory protein NosL
MGTHMISFPRTVCAVALAAVLAACGAADDSTRAEPPPVEETAFGDMVGTMDEARGVEDTTMQHKENIDQALRESEGEQ